MKIYVLSAIGILSLTFSDSVTAYVTDETLWAQSEYRAAQAAKREAARLEAEKLRREEEAKHLHSFDVNEVLRVIADHSDEISEVRIILKSGVVERYVVPVEDPAAAAVSETREAIVRDSTSTSKVESPFFNERGGRRPVW
jgi:hypothetical protein